MSRRSRSRSPLRSSRRGRSRSPAGRGRRERSVTPEPPKTNIVQISNISAQATREQLYQLFAQMGKMIEYKIYPSEINPDYEKYPHKMLYVRYEDRQAVAMCQHLTNTVLIDKVMVAIPFMEADIPDEESALKKGNPTMPGQRRLPPTVVNQITADDSGSQVLLTIDPQLSSLGLPAYPPLPSNTPDEKIEEIRRTVYVGNLPKEVVDEQLVEFFNAYIGEVMYIRYAGSSLLPVRYAYIEFTHQSSVPIALQNDGIDYFGQQIRIQHSRVPIIKPSQRTDQQGLKEVEAQVKMYDSSRMPSQSTQNLLSNAVKSAPTRTGWATATVPARRLSPMGSRRSPPGYRRQTRSPASPRRRGTRSPLRRDRSKEREERAAERKRRHDERDAREKEKERDRRRERDRSVERREKKSKDRRRSRSRDRDHKSSKRDRKEREIKQELKEKKKKDKKRAKEEVDEDDEMALRDKLLEKMQVKTEEEASPKEGKSPEENHE